MANIGSGPGWILRTGAYQVKNEIKQLAKSLIEDKCELRDALVSTLAVLDQVIDLSLVSSTVTGLSQTVNTPIPSNTPRSTHCPSPKSSLDISAGQSNVSSQIELSKNNNSTNADALDEDTASTTAESIVVAVPTPTVTAPPAPKVPPQPEPVTNVSESVGEEVLEPLPNRTVTPAYTEEIRSIASSEATTVDTSEVIYSKKASEAWAKLKEKFPNQTNWPVKIQHLDLGLPEVYVTAIIDITEHKDMSDEFDKALTVVPQSKAKPIESEILGNDWLVKRPESISSKNQFIRFRPTHIKDNMVKGQFFDCFDPVDDLWVNSNDLFYAKNDMEFTFLAPLKFIFKMVDVQIGEKEEAMARIKSFTDQMFFNLTSYNFQWSTLPGDECTSWIREYAEVDFKFIYNNMPKYPVARFPEMTLSEILLLHKAFTSPKYKFKRNQLFRRFAGRALNRSNTQIDFPIGKAPLEKTGTGLLQDNIWLETVEENYFAVSFQSTQTKEEYDRQYRLDKKITKLYSKTHKFRVYPLKWYHEGQLVIVPYDDSDTLYRAIITDIDYTNRQAAVAHLDYFSSDVLPIDQLLPLENGSSNAITYGLSERWLTQIVKLESKQGCDPANFTQGDEDQKTIRIRFVASLDSNVYKGEIDVDNMYVHESECSADLETASDDKYTTAVESIDNTSGLTTPSTESVPSMTVEVSSGVGELDTIELNSTANSTAIESAMSIHTSEDESLPSDSDSENEITVLNSPAVKIVDPSIDKTKMLDLMSDKWSKFCQSEKQLDELLDNNTLTGEIIDIIGIFVVLKSGYEDFRTELSANQLKKCSVPFNGPFFANSASWGLELLNITAHGDTFTLEMASRWEPSKIFQGLEELKKYLEAEKIELYFAEEEFKKYNIPRFVLINPFTIFKPDDTMMKMIKDTLPVTIDRKNLPLWKAKKVESEVFFTVQEFNDLPIECNFIANLDIRPVSENPTLSVQYSFALDEIYITNLLAKKSSRDASNLLANDAAIEYANVSGMKNHLPDFWPSRNSYEKDTARTKIVCGRVSQINVQHDSAYDGLVSIFAIRVDDSDQEIQIPTTTPLKLDYYLHTMKYVLFKYNNQIRRGQIDALHEEVQVVDIDNGLLHQIPFEEIYCYPESVSKETSAIICMLPLYFVDGVDDLGQTERLNPDKLDSFEIKFKIIGQCPYTSRYFVQIIYQKEGVYAKITDFYKSIGTAKEITTEKWDGNGDISQVDLERFTTVERLKEESDTSMTLSVAASNASSTQIIGGETIEATIISFGLSQEDDEQIVFRSIWKPLKKSKGPLACRQIVNLKKYHDLLQNKQLKLEDVEWSDLDKLYRGCTDYQLLLLHQDGLFRIEFDHSIESVNGDQAVFMFIDRATDTSVSIGKDDIAKVKKVKKEIIDDFSSVAVRLVDRKMLQYSSKIPKERLQALVKDSKYKFNVKMRIQESDLYNGDCQGTIFFSNIEMKKNPQKAKMQKLADYFKL